MRAVLLQSTARIHLLYSATSSQPPHSTTHGQPPHVPVRIQKDLVRILTPIFAKNKDGIHGDFDSASVTCN